MQSIFRLPWCTDHFGAGDNTTYGPGPFPAPVNVAPPKKLKRKRAVTPDPQHPPPSDVKRQRPATATASEYSSTLPVSRLPVSTPPLAATVDVGTETRPVETSSLEADKDNMTLPQEDIQMADAQVKTAPSLSSLQQAIENQLNLQILMKHNELRLIDQELAKCQIALEQLRRCEIKPYPGNDAFDYSLSSGTGPAVMPPAGYTKATHAPPHGVTDGPYTRHYRQWLLPDAQFDSQPPFQAISLVDDVLVASRSTRHAGARKSVAVATPCRLAEQRQSLPSYPIPAPRKDSSTPLVLRRSTDNKLVKLVCNNCNRGNMSSIQGFLNHCRIAHKVVYESHDAAAIDCGRILDDSEIASLPTEAQTMPISKPVVKHTPNRAVSVAGPLNTSTSVHPLNKPGVSTTAKPSKAAAVKPVVASLAAPQPPQFASTPFKAAVGAPTLSALFARRGCGGDLDQAVLDARRKPDFLVDDVLSPLTPGSPAVVTPTSGRGMLAVNGRSLGGKSRGQPQRPQHSYFAPAQGNDGNAQSPGESNLSPHTIDSNPGLVSDVEDDDNGSASEEESHVPHAPMPFGVRRDCTSNMDIDVAVDDGINQHGVVIRRNSILGAEDRNGHSMGGPSRKFGGD